MTTDLTTARDAHRLGAAVDWQLRQELIGKGQRLQLALTRTADAAQVGTDLPQELDDCLAALQEVRGRYELAVQLSRG